MSRFLWKKNEMTLKSFKKLHLMGTFLLHSIYERELQGTFEQFNLNIVGESIMVETVNEDYSIIHIEKLRSLSIERISDD